MKATRASRLTVPPIVVEYAPLGTGNGALTDCLASLIDEIVEAELVKLGLRPKTGSSDPASSTTRSRMGGMTKGNQ